MANDTLKSYTDLVNRVINDFNNIFNKMADKGVVLNNTGSTVISTNNVIPTNEYSTYIDNQLFRVDGKFKSDLSLNNGVIRYYGGNVIASSATISWDDTTATVTYSLPAPGYYNATVSKTISSSTVNLTAANIGSYAIEENEVLTGYTVIPPEGNLLGAVSMNLASVEVTDYTYTKSNETVTPTTAYDNTSSVALASAGDTTYAFKVTKSATYSVKSTAAAKTITKEEGYLSSLSAVDITNAEVTLSGTSTASTDTYYIKSGSVGNTVIASGTGSLSLSAATGGVTLVADEDLTTAQKTNYYELSANMAQATITGETVEGYISGGSAVSLGTLNSRSIKYYVAKGSVANTIVTNATITTSGTAATGGILSATASENTLGDYVLNINSSKTGNGAITEGYIKSGSYTYDVSGSDSYYIAHGKFVATLSTSAPTVTSGSGYLASGTTSYKITLSSTPSGTYSTAQEGYVKAADATFASATAATSDIYIKAGSASAIATLSVATVNTADNKPAEASVNSTPISIFQDSAPASGDYYTVQALASTSTYDAGYITNIGKTNSAIKYLPKATFRYVENSTSGNFLEVVSGGYIPSGTIAEFSTISGTLDAANVPVIATADSGSLLVVTPTENDYSITLGKGTVNAGYVSATEGTVSGSLYIHHGSVSVASALGSDGWTVTNATLSNNSYTITVSGTVNNTVTLDAGYIKATDVTTNGSSALSGTVALTTDVVLAQAVLALNSQQIKLHATATDNITLAGNGETAVYKIRPHISSGSKVNINASTAGYISTESQDFTITDHASVETEIALHAGTGNTGTNNASKSATYTGGINTSDLNTTKAAGVNYTITAPLTVTSTLDLDEGYYGSANKEITTISSITPTPVTIAHGSATINSSAVVTINGGASALTTYSAADIANRTATDFISLTASVASISVTKNVTTGYMKSADVSIQTPDTSTGGDTVYIEKVHLDTTSSNETYNTYLTKTAKAAKVYIGIELGSKTGALDGVDDIESTIAHATDTSSTQGLRDTAYIDTANKYASNDIKVTLSEHAMGTGVATELNRLRVRLNGVIS